MSETPQPIVMFNALWFKPDGGRETYQQYMRAVAPFIEAVGGRKLDSYLPDKAIIGEFDADLMFFVEYPSWSAFIEFVENEEYKSKVLPLREAALDNSLLVRCQRAE